MSVRFSIPLPGPFSVTAGNGTVWKHQGCYVGHSTKAAADAHIRTLAQRTPEQVRHTNAQNRVLWWIFVGVMAANVVAAVVAFFAL